MDNLFALKLSGSDARDQDVKLDVAQDGAPAAKKGALLVQAWFEVRAIQVELDCHELGLDRIAFATAWDVLVWHSPELRRVLNAFCRQ